MIEKELQPKEKKRRDFILNGSLFKVLIALTVPLAIYNVFNYLQTFIDMMMVSHIGGASVDSVVYFDEIKNAITAFGSGIAAGGTVIVARHYGAGQINEARKNAGVSFLLSILISLAVIILIVILSKPILVLMRTPQEIIENGLSYFNVQVISTGLMAINSVFIGLEKAKGNTKKILFINVLILALKIIITAVFVYGLNLGMVYVALATCIAQGAMTVFAIITMFGKKNSLRINIKDFSFKAKYVVPILMVSLPIFVGKFLFSGGKVVVNSMAAVYGSAVIGALGIAMKIGGLSGSLAGSFEESEISIISQNIGNKNLKRANKTFLLAFLASMCVASILTLITSLASNWTIGFFISSGVDDIKREMALNLFNWERFSSITATAISVILGLFYGFRLTKVSFYINLIRLFVFRIPVLWLFQRFTSVGYIALGYTMFISNFATMIVAMILYLIFFRHLRSYGYMGIPYNLDNVIE